MRVREERDIQKSNQETGIDRQTGKPTTILSSDRTSTTSKAEQGAAALEYPTYNKIRI